jgi:exodeoxyribonuclease-3
MRIATWNLNSVKARLPRLLSWLELRQPDVLLVQETKATEQSWPTAELQALGYESAHLGNGRWNGVGILSRVGLADVTRGLTEQPSFEGVLEDRAVGATCAGLRLWSLYVPNGREVGHQHFEYKLRFLQAVGTQSASERAALGTDAPFGLLGDFNVAPHDQDVWDIAAFDGCTHVSAPERAAVKAIQQASGPQAPLAELMPRASVDPEDTRHPYTFWEMRMLGFQKGRGMRIDLALVSDSLAQRVESVWSIGMPDGAKAHPTMRRWCWTSATRPSSTPAWEEPRCSPPAAPGSLRRRTPRRSRRGLC